MGFFAMIRRPLFMLLCVLALSCQPKPPPEPNQNRPRVWNIGARDLHTAYLDGSGRWTGQTVRIRLEPGNYEVAPGCVRWHDRRPSDAPAVVFAVRNCPTDNRDSLTIVGVVRGPVTDFATRPSGAGWYVRVDDCVCERDR